MFVNLFVTVMRRAQVRWHLHQSVGDLLMRQDDHLLDDIGLTRYQAEQLVANAASSDTPMKDPHAVRAFNGSTCCP